MPDVVFVLSKDFDQQVEHSRNFICYIHISLHLNALVFTFLNMVCDYCRYYYHCSLLMSSESWSASVASPAAVREWSAPAVRFAVRPRLLWPVLPPKTRRVCEICGVREIHLIINTKERGREEGGNLYQRRTQVRIFAHGEGDMSICTPKGKESILLCRKPQ